MRNRSGTLYTGVTNNLQRRVNEQRSSSVPGFTSKYRIRHLVYFEITNNVKEAIAREKQIKGWVRKRKIELIESVNPDGKTCPRIGPWKKRIRILGTHKYMSC